MHAIGDAKTITHPEQTGEAMGRLIYQSSVYKNRAVSTRLSDDLIGNTGDFPVEQSKATLAHAAQEIVSRWSTRKDDDLRTLPSALFCGWIAATDAMDEATAATASKMLHQAIELQLALRESYVPTDQDERTDPEIGLFGHTLALAQIDGWLPDSVLEAQIDRDSPLGKEFYQWKESNPQLSDSPPLLMLNWFPIECIEVALRAEAEQMKINMSTPGYYMRGFVTPNFRGSLLYIDLVLPLAMKAETDEFDTILWMLLEKSSADWVPRPRMEKQLLKLARRTNTGRLRREALNKVRRAGRLQKELTAYAREFLKSDSKQNLFDDWVLNVFLADDSWVPDKQESEGLLVIAKASFDFVQSSSRGNVSRSNEALVWRTRAALQLVTRLGQAGETGEELLREVLKGRGPQLPRSPPRSRLGPDSRRELVIGRSNEENRRLLFSIIRIHPDVLQDALQALTAIGGELSAGTKQALREIRFRAKRTPLLWPSNSESLAAMKAIEETIEAVGAATEGTDQ